MRLTLNGTPTVIDDVHPTTTLLEWLRARGSTGTKEGCAEGDCGACCVALRDGCAWRSVCACILPVGQLADREVVTVEGLADRGALHPAQQALVTRLGSQCGYCTPGFVMSLFEATYRTDISARWQRDDQLAGNLCRCTGYRPIREALDDVAGSTPDDRFAAILETPAPDPARVDFETSQGRFVRPESWDALWDVLSKDSAVVSGATDLGLAITKRRQTWPTLISLDALPGLRALSEEDDGWTVGAGVCLADLESWAMDRIPVLVRMLRFFASRPIKNRATVGGNLCNASPIGDLPPALLALDASVVLRSRRGERVLPLDAFFLGYRDTALAPDEVMAAVHIPRPPPGVRMGAYKVSKRRELDISTVCAAFVIGTGPEDRVSWVCLAYGGMAATPKRAKMAEEAIRGLPWGPATVEVAVAALARDFTPIDDHRGSAWYRTTVAGNLLRGFYDETLTDPVPSLPDRPSGTVLAGGER